MIIVRDGFTNAEPLVNRLLQATSLTVDHTLQIKIATIFGNKNETSLQLLERLDHAVLVFR